MYIILLFFADSASARIWPETVADFHQTPATGLREDQADTIVALVAKHQGYRVYLDGSVIERLTGEGRGQIDPIPGYFYYRIGFNGQNNDTIVYSQYYHINKTTGDVFVSRVPDSLECKRISFPELRKIQTLIMKNTGDHLATKEEASRSIGCR
ncbi:MAG: hypothetical protein F8N37_15405 [Telmatospirillum sp.]|nr:hypothetical protein [Telmatospirillum sp.]